MTWTAMIWSQTLRMMFDHSRVCVSSEDDWTNERMNEWMNEWMNKAWVKCMMHTQDTRHPWPRVFCVLWRSWLCNPPSLLQPSSSNHAASSDVGNRQLNHRSTRETERESHEHSLISTPTQLINCFSSSTNPEISVTSAQAYPLASHLYCSCLCLYHRNRISTSSEPPPAIWSSIQSTQHFVTKLARGASIFGQHS